MSRPIYMIGRAGAADVPAIVAISNAAAADGFSNFATEPEPLATWQTSFAETASMHPWVVARTADGAVAAFARSFPHRSRGAYRWSADLSVYVAREHQRAGLGARLYEALVATLRAQGYVTLMAGVALPSRASVALHEAFGFRAAGVFPRVGWKDGAWRDVGYWSLALRAGDDPIMRDGPRPLRAVDDVWSDLQIADEPLLSPDATALIAATNAELMALYPEPGAGHFRLDPEETAPGVGAFIIGRLDGAPVASGAIRTVEPRTVELKRMFVTPALRSRGLAARLVIALEQRARRIGATRAVLECGPRQPHALALYDRLGYRPIAPFAGHEESPLSVFLGKAL